ncbi:MAG TPA: hypothetical protein VMU34_15780, partial [Mycobacterium sp.]|nr:hypothetical protein [Mycobacterium sp.]
RIAAGDGGRAVVVWVERGPESGGLSHDQLCSAVLDPGTTTFEAPQPVDLDVGPADYVSPDVSMNANGTAYMVYRDLVATPTAGNSNGIAIPAGDALVNVKLARFNGWTWSKLDQPVNRNTSATVRFPSAQNAPKIFTFAGGGAIVAFQEPDASFVSRIWARRVFSATLGPPLQVSPSTYGGAPLRGDADAIAVSGDRGNGAVVAYRQSPGNPSNLDRARIMVDRIPDTSDLDNPASTFLPPVIADTLPAGDGSAPGPPSVSMNLFLNYTVTFGQGSVAQRAGLDSAGNVSLTPFGDWSDSAPAGPFTALADDGSTTSAVVTDSGIRVDESATGASALASLPGGGAFDDVKFASGNTGDAVVEAEQSVGADAKVMLLAVESPPSVFQVNVPTGWVRGKSPGLTWVRTLDDPGTIKYRIDVDGRTFATTAGTQVVFGRRIKDGRHLVQVTAIDIFGQSTAQQPFAYDVDRVAPKVHVRVRGRSVRVTVTDCRRNRCSGIAKTSRVRWGDGAVSKLRRGAATHEFAHSRSTTIWVTARDRAGNRRTLKQHLTF